MNAWRKQIQVSMRSHILRTNRMLHAFFVNWIKSPNSFYLDLLYTANNSAILTCNGMSGWKVIIIPSFLLTLQIKIQNREAWYSWSVPWFVCSRTSKGHTWARRLSLARKQSNSLSWNQMNSRCSYYYSSLLAPCSFFSAIRIRRNEMKKDHNFHLTHMQQLIKINDIYSTRWSSKLLTVFLSFVIQNSI